MRKERYNNRKTIQSIFQKDNRSKTFNTKKQFYDLYSLIDYYILT